METVENIEYKKAVGVVIGKSPPLAKIMAAANKLGTVEKSRKAEQGIWMLVFGMTDRTMLMCYRIYWGSARSTESSGALLKRMLSECMEETLFVQYETGMALFCLIAEGLPGGWQPGVELKKRIKEKVRPLITGVEKKSGADNSGKDWK